MRRFEIAPFALLLALFVAPAARAQAPVTPAAAPAEPLAGYNGSFFLRDPNDWFVLFPKGRLQVDGYFFPDRGDPMTGSPPMAVTPNTANDTRPRNTMFVRRARAEMQGTFFKHFDFSIAGEFGTTLGTGQYGTVTDSFVIVDYSDYIKLQAGQFDAPFTLENRTSDKYFDFMERSLAVRGFAVPNNKEDGVMLWGYLPNKFAYYSLGWFNGNGQNFKSQDNHGALIGRGFIAPFSLIAGDRKWMNDIWVGGSIWYQKAINLGGQNGVAAATGGGAQDDLPSLSTQGGFGFFSSNYNSNYKDGAGNTPRSHIAQNGDTLKWAVEANVPIKKFGLRFELVHQSLDISRYDDTNPTNARLVRSGPLTNGTLDGYGWYVEAFAWILGDTNFIESPGLELMPRLKKFKAAEPHWGLMVAAKYEHVGFSVANNSAPAAGQMKLDPAEGTYAIDAIELGVNAWATKHVRITANYVANHIDGTAENVTKNLYFQRWEHELLFRLGINL